MAKKSIVARNERRTKLSSISYEKRKKLKEQFKDTGLTFDERLKAQIKLSEMRRDTSKVRFKNRCAISGRARGYYRKFGLSRIVLRDLAAWGQIPGLIKSSW